ncbi:hypothetical protein GQ43DRAFT_273664 [Delitschia confertaspora ATCC 74209]|uniref:Chloride transporter, ClC family n=1 Tax=Delitschia confertaspora ATCC 74209 TaxID=1513339 RepID=A0A9P4MMJ1_9PLEO|nr:hypothetical protein GQ43DRAFT_273664 [Delitschia confertaspora ATCC 74209]
MDQDSQIVTEHTSLLHHGNHNPSNRLQTGYDEEAQSVISSGITKDELQMAGSIVGERLPYNDYTTIDWLHDLVKDSYRSRTLISHRNLCNRLLSKLEASSGWLAVILIGSLTACVAFIVDIGVATVSDWKIGYCTRNPLLSREACCRSKAPLVPIQSEIGGESNGGFRTWSDRYGSKFAVYVLFALAFGTISSSATMLTKRSLSAASPSPSSSKNHANNTLSPEETRQEEPLPSIAGKTMYMAAGSGIPEIKTILSGFVIPNFLSPTVLLVKAFGAVFAVSTGMWLGKEGPFVHISTCIGSIVGQWFPKYCDNGRKMRELLSAACAAGLSVAFGAPIGGVLFSYEEISTYFPRKVLWRAFLCSLSAAIILKTLNPTGTGKLVLFETNYGTSYSAIHYLAFILLGVAGGIFGGIFCAANFLWSRWFRSFSLIKNNPVLEVLLVVLVTAIVQFPNPLTREPGDTIIKNLLVDCQDEASLASSYVCAHESKFRSGTDGGGTDWGYIGMLTHGTLTKLGLTIITFGIKVPSGVIIPSLDAGAFFGRLVGQLHFLRSCISPGIFAMVGSAAFLAGVSRMTISLCVIMFELTGSLEGIRFGTNRAWAPFFG